MTDVKLLIGVGSAAVSLWLGIFFVWSLLTVASKLLARVRLMKIQSGRVAWSTLRHELVWSVLNVSVTTFVLQFALAWLVRRGYVVMDSSPASWYVVVLEVSVCLLCIDLYFYLAHRLIHVEPFYRLIHKTHHRSIDTNPLSYASMSPLEGLVEGIFTPLLLTCVSVHSISAYLVFPIAALAGVYVHCGYEFAPRWWYSVSPTKWLITPLYHDRHHRFYNCNYGAYTTIWDRIFGTMRSRFEQDFIELKDRRGV